MSILTGFLGAGKTTLLNRLLAAPGFGRTAVIVNEFGEIGVDHLLVEAVTGDMLVLTTGCICCAARGDLLDAVERLLARRADLGFDRVVIETTGLADPGPVLNALLLGPGLSRDPWVGPRTSASPHGGEKQDRVGSLRLAGVLTLVSAPDGAATLARHGEARRQVALADHILLTKGDLVAPSPDLVDRLAALNPSAPVADLREVALTPCLLDGDAGMARIPGAASHRHDHHAADARIRSLVLTAGIVEAESLAAFIADLQARAGAALLRLKGLAALRHAPERPVVVQVVGHLLHPATQGAGWRGAAPATHLVVILDGFDPAAVTALWDAYCGGPAIDRPDAAALMREGGAGLFG